METAVFTRAMFERMQQAIDMALEGLTTDELKWKPGPEANPIGFILWHQSRAEDGFVRGMIQGKPQLWTKGGWFRRFNMPKDPQDSGWGYTVEQVNAFAVPDLDTLKGYASSVRADTIRYLKKASTEDFAEIRKTPFGDLTVGQLFAMILCEIAQHVGQIAYIRGLQKGHNK